MSRCQRFGVFWASRVLPGFVLNFSKIARPMTELLKKGVRFNWDDKCEQAFQTLRKLLTSAPVLAQPDITRPFDVYCDVSGTGHGYILIPVYRRILFGPLILLSYTRYESPLCPHPCLIQPAIIRPLICIKCNRYGPRLCTHARLEGNCLCFQSPQAA